VRGSAIREPGTGIIGPDDPHFARKATAIQRSRAIPDRWDFFNQE
jgi:hypothetical protein